MRLHDYTYVSERVIKSLVLPSSGPSPYYMIILFPPVNNT